MKLSVNTPEGTRDRLFAECMGPPAGAGAR